MKTFFQKFTTHLPEIFHKEPPKKLPQQHPQKWSPRKKTALAALTTFSTLGASYLAYRYSFPKITIPNSPSASPIHTALKVVGSLTALAGLGLLAYNSSNQSNVVQKQKSKAKTDDDLSEKTKKEAINSKDADLLSPKSPESETIQNELENTEKTSDSLKSVGSNPTLEIPVEESYKDSWEKMISIHNDLDTSGKEVLISKFTELIQRIKMFFFERKNYIDQQRINLNELTDLAKRFDIPLPKTINSEEGTDLKNGKSQGSENPYFLKHYHETLFKIKTNVDQLKSSLNKLIDIADVVTGLTDPLSCRLVEHLFIDILPNSLHEMTQIIFLNDPESKDLVNRSCQLVYKALAHQMKIFLPPGIETERKSTTDSFKRILDLLTPFEKDDFRLSPDFYVNFIQYEPQLAWQLVNDYILEYVINKELSLDIFLLPDKIIANFLNERDNKNRNNDDKFVPRHTSENGLNILKKIVSDAQLSLFLDEKDEGAASFAIRLIQYKLGIEPKEFEKKHSNDSTILRELYSNLCTQKDLTRINNFAEENGSSEEGIKIAKILISKYWTTNFVNELLGSDITKIRQNFINLITLLVDKKEYSEKEMENIKALSFFIVLQIYDPSILQRAELATLALDQYTQIFLNVKSAKVIKRACKKALFIENNDLDTAYQKFLKDWETLNEFKPDIITGVENIKIDDSNEEELPEWNEEKVSDFNENEIFDWYEKETSDWSEDKLSDWNKIFEAEKNKKCTIS